MIGRPHDIASEMFSAQSEIQGPVSCSKYRSNRHTKTAAARQMIGRASSHMMSHSANTNKAAKRNIIARRLCHGGPGPGEIVRCGSDSASGWRRNESRLLS
jgi:hypothetical protein